MTSAAAEAAAQNDALLDISDTKPDGKPLTYKERVQARFKVLKDLIGEDQAKDIRTDKNYNLMMLGLRMSGAGQDPNALSNIDRRCGSAASGVRRSLWRREPAQGREDREPDHACCQRRVGRDEGGNVILPRANVKQRNCSKLVKQKKAETSSST